MTPQRKAETAPASAAAVLSALLDSDAGTPRGRPRLSREAVAYLRGAADALAAVETPAETGRARVAGVP